MLYTSHDLERLRKYLVKNSTPHETDLWEHLKSKKIGCVFKKHHRIKHYFVDFCCPQKRLIIEIHSTPRISQKIYDQERLRTFQELGFRIITVWKHEIEINTDEVILKIRNHLQFPFRGVY